ncbi:MAG: type toxin-antitoxin system VapC family toxin [Rhodospirillales bacterium]|nr:type toxin-antitoxin system VapC family toxin [Rhodospirillales bacterium]
MILVDTSVWIDHLHADDPALARLLDEGDTLVHPFVVGELALGRMRQRDNVLRLLRKLPQAQVATDDEVLQLIAAQKLDGTGLGYIDVHLLASLRLTQDAGLWTRDKRLGEIAARMGLAHVPSGGGVAERPAAYSTAPRGATKRGQPRRR